MFESYDQVLDRMRSQSGRIQHKREVRKYTHLVGDDEWNFLVTDKPEYVSLVVLDTHVVAVYEENVISVTNKLTQLEASRISEFTPLTVLSADGMDEPLIKNEETNEWVAMKSDVLVDYDGKWEFR